MSCMIKGKMRSGLLMPIFLGSFALQAAAISGGSDAGTLKQNLARDNKIIRIEPDRQRLLRNPQTGWVLYATPGVKEDFWEKCDNMQVPGVGTVKVSDYAHTLYIRTSWRKLNPEENVYGWNTDPMLKMLIEGARARKCVLLSGWWSTAVIKAMTLRPTLCGRLVRRASCGEEDGHLILMTLFFKSIMKNSFGL